MSEWNAQLVYSANVIFGPIGLRPRPNYKTFSGSSFPAMYCRPNSSAAPQTNPSIQCDSFV